MRFRTGATDFVQLEFERLQSPMGSRHTTFGWRAVMVPAYGADIVMAPATAS
jgi:hypothetical protein